MPDKCARCGRRILEGEPHYLAADPADLRRWHYDCSDPDAVEQDEVFLVE